MGDSPRNLRSWLQRAQVLLSAGDGPGAERALRTALQQDDRCLPALYNLGNLLQAGGEARAAAQCFEKALEVKPGFADAWQNLGRALLDLGRPEAAESAYLRALELNPANAQTFFNLGVAQLAKGDSRGAVGRFRQALDFDPRLVDAAINLACLLLDTGALTEALEVGARAVALAPADAATHNTLGAILEGMGEHEAALVSYRRAVALDPGAADLRFNLATELLRLGQWQEGWGEYEARLGTDCCPPREPVAPVWDGGPLAGRSLLVLAEQGLGDTVQFCRYLPLIPGAGDVVFLVQPGLGGLLRGFPGTARVLEWDLQAPLPAGLNCAFQVNLGSLPGLLETRLGAVPAEVPYLHPEPHRLVAMADRLGPREGLRVGLVYAGNPGHRRDRHRSCPLEALSPLLGIPGVRFYALQQGAGRGLAEAGAVDLAPGCIELEDLAAALASMDLILSVDTMPAHLAGALGVPVWLLLDSVPDWRWMLTREDSPWYPSMRLFRQPSPGAWPDVVAAVGRALAALA